MTTQLTCSVSRAEDSSTDYLLLEPLDHIRPVVHPRSTSLRRQGGVPLGELGQCIDVHRLSNVEEACQPIRDDSPAGLLDAYSRLIMNLRVSGTDPDRVELPEKDVGVFRDAIMRSLVTLCDWLYCDLLGQLEPAVPQDVCVADQRSRRLLWVSSATSEVGPSLEYRWGAIHRLAEPNPDPAGSFV